MRSHLRLPPTANAVLELDGDQLATYNYITTQFVSPAARHSRAATFFFTGGGGTGKSFLLSSLEGWLVEHKWRYAKTTPTGISANHIGGRTIHSTFGISQRDGSSSGSYQTCIMERPEMLDVIRGYKLLIIDEMPMVSDELFGFLSDFFARVRRNKLPHGGIHVVVFGDLMQLPPVSGRQVFHAPQWRHFIPMFLTRSRRHDRDSQSGQMLEAIQFGNINDEILTTLLQRYHEFDIQSLTDRSTALISLKVNVSRFNDLMLERCCVGVSYEHQAVDKERGKPLQGRNHPRQFK